MYADHPPVPNCPAKRVLVLEEKDKPYDLDTICRRAMSEGAVTMDNDDNQIYWIVFPGDPKRAWDCTEHALAEALKKHAA